MQSLERRSERSATEGDDATMIEEHIDEAGKKMDKALEATDHDFKSLRTGRATSSMLDLQPVGLFQFAYQPHFQPVRPAA